MTITCTGPCEREIRDRRTPASAAPGMPRVYNNGMCGMCWKQTFGERLTPTNIEWVMTEARRMMTTEAFWHPTRAA
jgi:hypothetical protein